MDAVHHQQQAHHIHPGRQRPPLLPRNSRARSANSLSQILNLTHTASRPGRMATSGLLDLLGTIFQRVPSGVSLLLVQSVHSRSPLVIIPTTSRVDQMATSGIPKLTSTGGTTRSAASLLRARSASSLCLISSAT